MTPRPYRIRITGQRTRVAATRRLAMIALGQMMTNVPAGTIGTITRFADGVELPVLTGRCESLGLDAGCSMTAPRCRFCDRSDGDLVPVRQPPLIGALAASGRAAARSERLRPTVEHADCLADEEQATAAAAAERRDLYAQARAALVAGNLARADELMEQATDVMVSTYRRRP